MRTAPVLFAALVLVTGCGGTGSDLKVTGTVDASGAASEQSVSLDMKDDLTFVPNVVNAKVGTLTLTLSNIGQVPHNLVFDQRSLGATGTVRGRASEQLKVTFAKAGTFTFVCTFHSGMDGKVVVSP